MTLTPYQIKGSRAQSVVVISGVRGVDYPALLALPLHTGSNGVSSGRGAGSGGQ